MGLKIYMGVKDENYYIGHFGTDGKGRAYFQWNMWPKYVGRRLRGRPIKCPICRRPVETWQEFPLIDEDFKSLSRKQFWCYLVHKKRCLWRMPNPEERLPEHIKARRRTQASRRRKGRR